MSDAVENLVLAMLRRMDGKLDGLVEDLQDIKYRMTSAEPQLGELRVDLAGVSGRLDRLDLRAGRIERRLDLAEV